MKRLKVLATASLVLSQAPAALASVSLQTHTPTSNSTYTLTEDALLDSSPLGSLWTGPRLFFSAEYNILDKPLTEYNSDHSLQTGLLYNTLNTLDLQAGIFVRRDLELSFGLPMNVISPNGQASQFGLGDIRLQGKYRLTNSDALVAISIIPELSLPTGNSDLLLSGSTVGVGARMAFEKDFGRIRASANIGYRYTPGAVYQSIDYSQQIPISLGTYTDIGRGFGLNVEATEALSLPLNRFNNPGEVYVGGRYQVNRETMVLAGISVGSIDPTASGDFRAIAGVKFSPMPAPAAPRLDTVMLSKAAPVTQPVAKTKSSQRVRVKIKHKTSSTSKSVPVKRSAPVVAKRPVAKKPVAKLPTPKPQQQAAASRKSSHAQNSEFEVEVQVDPAKD